MRFCVAVACCALGAVCVSASGQELREKLGFTLEQMRSAAMKGDPEAYLANLDTHDPVFRTEQENWAADLKRVTPTELSFDLGRMGDPKPWTTVISSIAYFDLNVTWTMPAPSGEGTAPAARTASFPASFIFSDDKKQWLYAGEDWLERESRGDGSSAEKSIVKFFPGAEATARGVAGVLPAVRRAVHEMFGVTIRRTQEVKLYSSLAHLQFSIYLSYSDPLTGWSEPGESMRLVVSPGLSEERLRRLLAHEYTHFATFEMGKRAGQMPWWALEGAAELAAERIGGAGASESPVEKWAAEGALAPWEDLADFRGAARSNGTKVYAQGRHMLAFITTTGGESGRNAWLKALANGALLEDATVRTLGMSFAELDRRWRESLMAKP